MDLLNALEHERNELRNASAPEDRAAVDRVLQQYHNRVLTHLVGSSTFDSTVVPRTMVDETWTLSPTNMTRMASAQTVPSYSVAAPAKMERTQTSISNNHHQRATTSPQARTTLQQIPPFTLASSTSALSSDPMSVQGVIALDVADYLDTLPQSDDVCFSAAAPINMPRYETSINDNSNLWELQTSTDNAAMNTLPVLMTPSSSMSTHRTVPSFISSSEMTRKSSMTSANSSSQLRGAVDMLRLDSFMSERDCLPFLSCVDNVHPSSTSLSQQSFQTSHSNLSFDIGNTASLISHIGYGPDSDEFLSVSDAFAGGHGVDAQSWDAKLSSFSTPHLQASDMERTLSQASDTSTASNDSTSSRISTSSKASDRLRRQVDNANNRPVLVCKPEADVVHGASMAGKLEAPSTRLPNNEDSRGGGASLNGRQAIEKLPSAAPIAEARKLLCPHCKQRDVGFRGEHELRRHYENAHQAKRKRWVITLPSGELPTKEICSKSMNQLPSSLVNKENQETLAALKRPLNKCNDCLKGKTYQQDYNAVAHLRRCHFNPRKRGRRPRGEVRESRAGQSGGDKPTIQRVKGCNLVKQITVYNGVTDVKTIDVNDVDTDADVKSTCIRVKESFDEQMADDEQEDSAEDQDFELPFFENGISDALMGELDMNWELQAM